MHIDKWWNNIVGGTDDSLLLIDYFGAHATINNLREHNLKSVLDQINLAKGLKNDAVEETDVFYQIEKGVEPHFDMALDVIIDLSALVIESLVNKKILFEDLDNSTEYSGEFSILADKGSIALLKKGLDDFIEHPTAYMLYELSRDDGDELVDICREISNELKAYIK